MLKNKARWIVLTLVLLISLPVSVSATVANEIIAQLAAHYKIVSNGVAVDTGEDVPIKYNNKTYLPVRAVGEALGFEVKWDEKTQTVHLNSKAGTPPKSDSQPVIQNKDIEIITVGVKPRARNYAGQETEHLMGSFNVSLHLEVKHELDRKAAVLFEVLNDKNTVVASRLQEIHRTKAGTDTVNFTSSEFQLPYDQNKVNKLDALDLMVKDYTYRITIK